MRSDMCLCVNFSTGVCCCPWKHVWSLYVNYVSDAGLDWGHRLWVHLGCTVCQMLTEKHCFWPQHNAIVNCWDLHMFSSIYPAVCWRAGQYGNKNLLVFSWWLILIVFFLLVLQNEMKWNESVNIDWLISVNIDWDFLLLLFSYWMKLNKMQSTFLVFCPQNKICLWQQRCLAGYTYTSYTLMPSHKKCHIYSASINT